MSLLRIKRVLILMGILSSVIYSGFIQGQLNVDSIEGVLK